jgi:hypothetical protein
MRKPREGQPVERADQQARADAQQRQFRQLRQFGPCLRLRQHGAGITGLHAAQAKDLLEHVDPLAFDPHRISPSRCVTGFHLEGVSQDLTYVKVAFLARDFAACRVQGSDALLHCTTSACVKIPIQNAHTQIITVRVCVLSYSCFIVVTPHGPFLQAQNPGVIGEK